MAFELDKNSFSRYLGRSFNMLIELTHSELDPFYFINDTQELILDGKTYLPFPFDIIRPSQPEKQGTTLIMTNANQLVTNELTKISYSNENVLCQLYLVNVEENTAEKYDKGLFEIMGASVESMQTNFNINLRTSLDVNIGTIRYNKTKFGNIFL